MTGKIFYAGGAIPQGETSVGGEGGTTNYNELSNRPTINGVLLAGNKTSADLNLDITEHYGIKGDYCSKYGIISAQYGLVDYRTLDNEVTVKAGIQLIIPNKETRTQIGSDIKYEIQSIVDVTLFYADGDIIEADMVYYQTQEPPENGQFAFIAWWNPTTNTWSFKSNNTGNVWRQVDATPIADVHFSNENIVRIDHVGYRHINTLMVATQDDIEHNRTEIEELAEELGSVSNSKVDRNMANLTEAGNTYIKTLVAPTSVVVNDGILTIDELPANTIYHAGTLTRIEIKALGSTECVPETCIKFTAGDTLDFIIPESVMTIGTLMFDADKQYIVCFFDNMVIASELTAQVV